MAFKRFQSIKTVFIFKPLKCIEKTKVNQSKQQAKKNNKMKKN